MSSNKVCESLVNNDGRKMLGVEVASCKFEGAYRVTLYHTSEGYMVVYGGEKRCFEPQDATRAFEYFGNCMHHAYNCSDAVYEDEYGYSPFVVFPTVPGGE